MSYQITFKIETSYIHAIITGENTLENIMNYLREIKGKCQSSGVFRVLIEERLEGARLETMAVFQVAQDGSRENQGVIREVAYVDINARGDLMKFAETAALNRGFQIKVFNRIQDAEEWLTRPR